MQVHTVNSNSQTTNCQCSLYSKKNPIIRIFCISGRLAVQINPDEWSSTVFNMDLMCRHSSWKLLWTTQTRVKTMDRCRHRCTYRYRTMTLSENKLTVYNSWQLSNLMHKFFSTYLFIYSSLHVSSMTCQESLHDARSTKR